MLKLCHGAIALAALCSSALSATTTQLIDRYVPNYKEVGQGSLSVLFWDVYDATLFAPEGRWQNDLPYALSITYLMDLDGDEIAERSAKEIRQQGFNNEIKLALWHQKMETIFPDVEEKSVLTGIYDSNQNTIFYKDNQRIGVIKDPDFGRWFFSIWLGEKTSEPDLRAALLGQSD